jgi:hypothetical protein
MRQKRQQRITDTKRILQFLYSEGWSDAEIATGANCSLRSIQRWWDDVCPSPKKFHRLWMLEDRVKNKPKPYEKEKDLAYVMWNTHHKFDFIKECKANNHPDKEICEDCEHYFMHGTVKTE